MAIIGTLKKEFNELKGELERFFFKLHFLDQIFFSFYSMLFYNSNIYWYSRNLLIAGILFIKKQEN